MATNLTDLTVSGTVTAAAVSGPVTGAVTGNVTGGQILPTASAYANNGAIALTDYWASLTKSSAGAYTLAAPGASNVGKILTISAGTAQAHVVTVTGLANGNTLTFTNTVGTSCQLLAVSSTVWGLLATAGVTLSTV